MRAGFAGEARSGAGQPGARRPTAAALAVVLACAGLSAAAPAPERVALTNARIIPVEGPEIARGTLLIERGKIAALGETVDVPFDARVFDLAGKTLLPGLVNVHTARGMDISNEPRPVTPQLDVYDAIDPSQLFFEDCLRLGHTAVHVIPGNNCVIGGLGRVVRPIGMSVDELTIAEGSFLKLSITPRSGFDRMLQMATLRETFQKLDDFLEKTAEQRYEAKRKEEKKDVDVGPAEARKRGRELIRIEDVTDEYRNVLRLRGGVVRVAGEEGPALFKPLGAFVHCRDAMDITLAARLAQEQDFWDRTVFVLGGECYKAVSELSAAARPVVLPEDLLYRETDPLTGDVRETFVAKPIADAGLMFALIPAGNDSLAERMLVYQAARCVREGIGRDTALRAVTINPARMLGLEKRLGSLEVGKDASVVVYSGDPLDFNSVVEKVFIDGILAYEREKDVRLKRLLTPEHEATKP